MIAAQRRAHHQGLLVPAPVGFLHDLLPRGADGQDGSLRRVNDGRELLDPEHAEVADRERAADHVRRAQLAVLGLARERPHLAGDAGEAQAARAANHGHHQTRIRLHRDGDVSLGVLANLIAHPAGVDVRALLERERGRLDDEIVHRDFAAAVGEQRAV